MIPKISIEQLLEKHFDINSYDFIPISFMHPKFQSGNVSLFELTAMNFICYLFQPKDILEIGTFNGRSTINILVNSLCFTNSSKIVTVDLPKEKINYSKLPLEDGRNPGLDELGFIGRTDKLFINTSLEDQIEQLWMDSVDIDTVKYDRFFDLIFIDASHSYDYVINDSMIANLISKNKSIIIWHDYNGWPGVTKALNEFYNIQSEKQKQNFYWINDTSLAIMVKVI